MIRASSVSYTPSRWHSVLYNVRHGISVGLELAWPDNAVRLSWLRSSIDNPGFIPSDQLNFRCDIEAQRRLGNGDFAIAAAQKLVNGWAARTRAVRGYVTIDGNDMPYHSVTLCDCFDSVRWLAGYYWATLLGPVHCDLMGGRDYVLRAAPCSIREAIDGGGAYLQITERIEDLTRDDLLSLRAFLRPLLPAPTRVVDRPDILWVFESQSDRRGG